MMYKSKNMRNDVENDSHVISLQREDVPTLSCLLKEAKGNY